MNARSKMCRHCGNEKIRFERGGSYRFQCHCLAWREYMKVLERARKAEGRRTRRKSVPVPEVPAVQEAAVPPAAEPAPEAVVA